MAKGRPPAKRGESGCVSNGAEASAFVELPSSRLGSDVSPAARLSSLLEGFLELLDSFLGVGMGSEQFLEVVAVLVVA